MIFARPRERCSPDNWSLWLTQMEALCPGTLDDSLQAQRTTDREKRYSCAHDIPHVFERVQSNTQNIATFCLFNLIYHCLFVLLQ